MEQIHALRSRVPAILEADPGQPIGGIASSLGVPIELAQTVIRPLVGAELETRGVRRGMKYYVTGQAPPEEDEEAEPASIFEVEARPGFESSSGTAS
jgi:hypothetical protein